MDVENHRILLVNAGWSDNLGDQAIRLSLEQILRDRGCNVDFADLIKTSKREHVYNKSKPVRNEKGTDIAKKLYSLKLTRPLVRNVQRIYQGYKTYKTFSDSDYDMMIIGGGQLLLPQFAWPVFMWSLIATRVIGCPLVFFGVGAEGRYNLFERWMLKAALSNARHIYFRDHKSIDLISSLLHLNANYAPDVAFCLRLETECDIESERPLALIAPMSYRGSYSRYLEGVNSKEEFDLCGLV